MDGGYTDEVARARARRRIRERRERRSFEALLDRSSVGEGLRRLREDPAAELARLEREMR